MPVAAFFIPNERPRIESSPKSNRIVKLLSTSFDLPFADSRIFIVLVLHTSSADSQIAFFSEKSLQPKEVFTAQSEMYTEE